jgi:general secretion pathway protein H
MPTSATGATEAGEAGDRELAIGHAKRREWNPASAPINGSRGRLGTARPVESRIPNPHSRLSNGFSLIELLVVLVIIGVVLATVTLAIGGSGDRELENAARRAQARIALACERALVGGHDIGFSLVEDRLRFGYLTPQGWQPFAPRAGEELRERSLGEGLALELLRDGIVLDAVDALDPQLACFSSGELTPFELRLARADVGRHFILRGGLDGRILLEASDAG